jgi:alpha/beta superfamily hydrolase
VATLNSRGTEVKVYFPSASAPQTRLEGWLGAFADKGKHAAAVLCHPGSRGQGGYEYPVIAGCAGTLHRAGLITLRFNFRGVQGSEGSRSRGLHEVGDVLGAVQFLRSRSDVEPSQLFLLGDSFGALMALEAFRRDTTTAGIICIVLPLALMPSPPAHLRTDPRPKLFIAAQNDQFCNLADLEGAFGHWARPKDLIIIEGSDHFLGIGPSTSDPVDRTTEVAETVAAWLGTNVRQADHIAVADST